AREAPRAHGRLGRRRPPSGAGPMKPHKTVTEKVRAQVTEFLFGGMSPEAQVEFEGHLESCETCRNETASQRGIAVELGFVAPPKRPRLKTAKQPWRVWPQAREGKPLTFVAGGPEGFEPTAYPGVFAKQLFVDQKNDRVTMMVRMAPSASYPSHKHAGV